MFNFKFYNKHLGLMFRNLKDDEIAELKNYKQETLHTLFVFYPINIIFLDDKNRVIGIKRNVKPFTFKIIPNKKAKHVLEFKSVNTKNIKIGQKINI
ncbi:MAG: DUF192 domain-containing protein [Nanoarchaeota archaeon]